MPLPKPVKPTLRIESSEEDVRRRNSAMFHDWADECEAMHHAFVEGLLSQMPTLQAGARNG